MSELKVGLVQMACSQDQESNRARAAVLVREAARRGATAVALPELFASHYFPRTEDTKNFDLAEPLCGSTAECLRHLAVECKVTLIGSIFERRAAGVFHNTAVVFDAEGRQIGLYRKMHIPDDPSYFEKFYFSPGDLGFPTFNTDAGKLGVQVCWDQWFPEGARLLALRGAKVLFYPTAIGWHPSDRVEHGAAQLDAWKTVQRGHAIANGVFVVAINRVGHEGPDGDGLTFWGHSFVSDPFGVVLAEAGEGEELLVVRCDAERLEDVRRNWPFLRDRRVDAYGGLCQRFLDE